MFTMEVFLKVVILAGGFGTRFGEMTENLPKPMLEIGGRPILWHIMNHYAKFGYDDFYIALGYKSAYIKEYFLKLRGIDNDISIDFTSGDITYGTKFNNSWKVTLVDTGLNTMTGGRIKRLQNYLEDETFLLTYGDAISDVNITDLVDFHHSRKTMVTVTAVHPKARFGEIQIENDLVTSFKEKPLIENSWINGGFFVVDPIFLRELDADSIVFEREPLEKLVRVNQLSAFKHEGFWQCMDNKRELEILERIWESRGSW